MKIDEVMLRAYADGELSSQENQQIEVALANSEALRQQLKLLNASALPYRAAFDIQYTAPVPPALQKQLSALSAVAHSQTKINAGQSKWHLFQQWLSPLALAASFLVGCAATLLLTSLFAKPATIAQTPAWVKAVASYQSMYVRDTVDRVADTSERAAAVLASFKQETGIALGIPNLSAAGLEFKRVQRLGIKTEPHLNEQFLVQMAYLPSKGKPGALCVLKAPNQLDVAVSSRRLDNLSIVTWQKNQLSYVFAVDLPLDQASQLGKQLSEGQVSLLYQS